MSQRTHDTAELTPLGERLRLLLLVRLFMALTVLVSTWVLPQLPVSEAARNAAWVYALVAVGAEGMHRLLTRHTARRWLIIVNTMLLVDGLFVATVLAGTGQSRSIFIFLAYAHVVSVTLLVGFRTGLKIALWHSILLLTVYYLVLTGWLSQKSVLGVQSDGLTTELEVAQACALWLVALLTAGFSSLNERELRRRKGELTIIAELSAKVEQTRRPSDILGALIESATHMGCTRALAVWAHGGKMTLLTDERKTQLLPFETLGSLGGAAERAVTTGPVFMRQLDPRSDSIIDNAMPKALNVAFIPLVAEGEVVALLVAEWAMSNKRRVTKPMVSLLAHAASRVALSLSNTFLLAEIQRLATVDGLTGMPNRRTFNQTLEREVARSMRNGQPVTLVMLDIDHFKNVNDTYGHQTGDKVLAESASGVMNACRENDVPARYGGEEMAVILPNCPPEDALAAAERIRRGLCDANVTLPGTTASAGVASFPANASSITELLEAADSALYKSKEGGRNRSTQATANNKAADAIKTIHERFTLK